MNTDSDPQGIGFTGSKDVVQRCYRGVPKVLQRCYKGWHKGVTKVAMRTDSDSQGIGFTGSEEGAAHTLSRPTTTYFGVLNNDYGVTITVIVLQCNGYGVTG
jgi:hypothetical protein